MSRRILHPRLHLALTLLCCVVVASGAGCADDAVDPLIEALLPARGKPGAVVDVVGERFSAIRGHVCFGGVPAQILIWSERRARVTVPDAGLAGLTLVVLTAGGRPSNAVNFLVEGSPRPDAAIPDLGPFSDGPIIDLPVHDTAAPDAVVPDAVVPDAVVPDAAVPDAAAPDAAAPDAAVPDAAVPDAVMPDATVLDAVAAAETSSGG